MRRVPLRGPCGVEQRQMLFSLSDTNTRWPIRNADVCGNVTRPECPNVTRYLFGLVARLIIFVLTN